MILFSKNLRRHCNEYCRALLRNTLRQPRLSIVLSRLASQHSGSCATVADGSGTSHPIYWNSGVVRHQQPPRRPQSRIYGRTSPHQQISSPTNACARRTIHLRIKISTYPERLSHRTATSRIIPQNAESMLLLPEIVTSFIEAELSSAISHK